MVLSLSPPLFLFVCGLCVLVFLLFPIICSFSKRWYVQYPGSRNKNIFHSQLVSLHEKKQAAGTCPL